MGWGVIYEQESSLVYCSLVYFPGVNEQLLCKEVNEINAGVLVTAYNSWHGFQWHQVWSPTLWHDLSWLWTWFIAVGFRVASRTFTLLEWETARHYLSSVSIGCWGYLQKACWNCIEQILCVQCHYESHYVHTCGRCVDSTKVLLEHNMAYSGCCFFFLFLKWYVWLLQKKVNSALCLDGWCVEHSQLVFAVDGWHWW